MREAKIIEIFKHPNIIHFREGYMTKSQKYCIVMDFAAGGDLHSLIKEKHIQKKQNEDKKIGYWEEEQILSWFTQICLAIKHSHDRHILHRDIKPQNIFLTESGDIKLGDFGVAKVLNDTHSMANSFVGAPYYLPPEMILGKDYTFPADIWSLGVTLYELCTLRPPFMGKSPQQLFNKVLKSNHKAIPDHYSKIVHNLLMSMLQKDPSKRPTIN